jgi:hypothetical protein
MWEWHIEITGEAPMRGSSAWRMRRCVADTLGRDARQCNKKARV